jgi:hypothetical protein
MLLYTLWNYFKFLVLVFQKTLESYGHLTLKNNSVLHDGFIRHNQL